VTDAAAISIEGLAAYLPATREPLPDDVRERTGAKARAVLKSEEMPYEVALLAAEGALGAAGASGLGAVLAVNYLVDHVAWSSALKVAHAMGAGGAVTFDLSCYDAGFHVAIAAAEAMMATEPAIDRALVFGGYRLSDWVDPDGPMFCRPAADGAAAVHLVRGGRGPRLLGAGFRADYALCEAVVVPGGGSRHPASEETLARGLHRFRVLRPGFERRLDRVALPGAVVAAREALARSGRRPGEVSALVVSTCPSDFATALARRLGVDPVCLVRYEDHGHAGPADAWIALRRAEREGRLAAGDLVLVGGFGLGATFFARALAWEPLP